MPRSSKRSTSSQEPNVDLTEQLPEFLAGPSLVGTEISVTGTWVPSRQGARFRTTEESTEMLAEWEDIHGGARSNPGVLSTEINHAVGEDAVLVHHVFADADAMVDYFASTATRHLQALTRVATPQIHLVRGTDVPERARDAISTKGVPVAFGEHIYGYVKHENQQPDPETAVQVTAKWTNTDGGSLDELKYWWQRVGTDAHSMEEGLVRFEAYDVIDEDALIIHETFATNADLKFHLTKGTAAKYKKDIDQIAAPENYFFRGPVSWSIRTYSKFMHLPATYSRRGSHHTRHGGTGSDGRTG
jgi:quinol monooxygenase YgiN